MIKSETIIDYKRIETASLRRCADFFERLLIVNLDDINMWLAGGCFRAYFSRDEQIQDIDLFFPSAKEAARCVRSLRKVGFKHFFSNRNAIKGFINNRGKRVYIDIVKRYYENEEKALEDFDFSVSKFAYNPKTKTFFYSEFAFVDISTKRIVIPDVNFGNPIGSLKRLQKYVKKGYTACNGALLTIAKRISETDLTNPEQNDIEFYPDGGIRILPFD
jgi:hypothetical protein